MIDDPILTASEVDELLCGEFACSPSAKRWRLSEPSFPNGSRPTSGIPRHRLCQFWPSLPLTRQKRTSFLARNLFVKSEVNRHFNYGRGFDFAPHNAGSNGDPQHLEILAMTDDHILTVSEVNALLCIEFAISPTSAKRWRLSEPSFPKPCTPKVARQRWRRADVMQWVTIRFWDFTTWLCQFWPSLPPTRQKRTSILAGTPLVKSRRIGTLTRVEGLILLRTTRAVIALKHSFPTDSENHGTDKEEQNVAEGPQVQYQHYWP